MHTLICFRLSTAFGVLITATLLLVSIVVGAQPEVRLLSGPRSNTIFLLPPAGQNIYEQVAEYRVLRASAGRTNFREIGRLTFPTEYATYQAQIGPQLDSLFQQAYATTDGSQLLHQVQSNPSPYFFFLVSPKLWRLNGWLFEDTDTRPGQAYDYQIWSRSKRGTDTQVFAGRCQTGGADALVRQFKLRHNHYEFSDSTLFIGWQSRNTNTPTAPTSLTGLQDKTYQQRVLTYQKEQQAYQSLIGILSTTSFDLLLQAPLTYSLYRRQNGGNWQLLSEPYGTSEANNFSLTWADGVQPEQVYEYYVTPKDFLGNTGIPSDTIAARTFDRFKLPLVDGLRIIDTTGGLALRWKALPAKFYFRGIEITRQTAHDSPIDRRDTVDISATTYFDRTARPRQGYYYKVTPLLVPFPGSDSIKYGGVETYGMYTKLPPPLPVQQVRITQEGRHVRLRWKAPDRANLFKIYVFRGTSPATMESIGAAEQSDTYLDTDTLLSGRTTYLYVIQVMDLNQKSSDFSDTVSIQPRRPVSINPPAGLTAAPHTSTNGVLVKWTDMRLGDNAVVGYALQRRLKGKGRFSPVNLEPVTGMSYVDTNTIAGLDYEYRLACVGFNQDTSKFSYPVTVTLPAQVYELYMVRNISVRNTTKGIEIALPSVLIEGVTGYHLYRRELNGTADFQRIASFKSNEFVYTDAKTVPERTYVYSVTAIDRGYESPRAEEKTIRRLLLKPVN